ncbi:DUF7522 family protein [Halorussus salinus]|uniref:DUF7522 family protein n=1 Tax=Halorussus salinus TaxID=1364935 RepID=UPI0010923ED4|nr:hypothetical protein [Halorussus salinus]
MDSESPSALTDGLRTNVGDGLRTVAVGRVPEEEYDVTYMRSDIDDLYTDEMRENILEEIVLEHIAEARKEGLFPPLGALEYTIRVFEEGINLVGWTDETAVFVGLDADPELIAPAVAACRREL